MNFSEDWKSYFPVPPSHAPLLERSVLGPLIFNPDPQTLTQLFSSSSLLPPPIHVPRLSLSQFLATATPEAPIPPPTASSIASLFGAQIQDDLRSALRYNQFEILKYQNGALLFFPTGENFERVGYLMVYVESSDLRLKLNANKDIFQVSCGGRHRISKILVNPIDDGNESSSIVGYLLISTCYTIHWFSVHYDSHRERPCVALEGSKTFKTCSITHTCWSPHILQESLVLLESGELFLFDLQDCKEDHNFKGNKLKVEWPESSFSKDPVWVSCEFSWNPRLFIVATFEVIFLVDGTKGTYNVSCLLKVELLNIHVQARNEHFLALSRAGPNNFYFTVASNNFLLLCDVRKQMMPIIRWAHDLDNPTYINVVNLSQLRSHSKEDAFDSATKDGFCIILGSFYNGNFNLFCFGSLPSKEGSFASKLSKIDKTLYAWELPCEIAVFGHYCHCGSCLLQEELSKDLPQWIDWRIKKDMVMGFSILNDDIASLLCEPDKYGGFTLVRLMSSGKLELQRYQASWVTNKTSKNCHGQGVPLNKYLFSVVDEKYKFPKSFVFMKSNYLYSCFRGNLTEELGEKLKGIDVREKKSLDVEVHEALCEKLKACGVGSSRSSHKTIAFFKDVKQSASLYEVALRGLWAKLPMHILQLAFSKHTESSVDDQEKVSLEFLAVPPLNRLPPFLLRKSWARSNKCFDKVQSNDNTSDKEKCDNDIVGPILPLAVLVGLHKIDNGSSDLKDCKFSVETEVRRQCEEVMKVAGEISVSALGSELFDDLEVSPDDPSRSKPFVLYRPNLFECPAADLLRGNFIDQYKIHHTLAFNFVENNEISSAESTSNDSNEKFGACDFKAYNVLKTHMSRWKEGFGSYKKFSIQNKIQKAVKK